MQVDRDPSGAASSAADFDIVDINEEFSSWVGPHWVAMARLAQRLAPTAEWEDVLQDALADSWRKRAQFDGRRGTARNWLLAIVADHARKRYRWSARRRSHSLDSDPPDPREQGHDLDLERAIRGLSLRQQTAVVLHYFLGLSISDTAIVMACAPGTVKSTLSDARGRLRRELGEDHR